MSDSPHHNDDHDDDDGDNDDHHDDYGDDNDDDYDDDDQDDYDDAGDANEDEDVSDNLNPATFFSTKSLSCHENILVACIVIVKCMASRQVPPGQVPPGQVPLWTSSILDKFPWKASI